MECRHGYPHPGWLSMVIGGVLGIIFTSERDKIPFLGLNAVKLKTEVQSAEYLPTMESVLSTA